MDEQNNQDGQYNPQNAPAEIPPAYVPPETPPPAQPFQTIQQPLEQPVRSSSGKKPLLIAVGILLAVALIVGLALAWLMMNSKSTPDNHTTHTSEQQTKATVFSQPENLVYARGDGKDAPYALYAKSVTSNDQVEAMTLPSNVHFTGYPGNAIYGNQVALATTDTVTRQDSIYFSSDGGKNYKKIYTGGQDGQITSLAFASNGKSIVIGLNPSPTSGNQVTEISLEGDHQTKALFRIDEAGVFLKGYDQEKQKVVYFSGCYNCDGGAMKDLRLYDIINKKQETLYSAANMIDGLAINHDFTKILIAEGTLSPATDSQPFASTKAPYLISSLDISNKTKETVMTIDGGTLKEVGYTPAGKPYALTNKRAVSIADGKLTTIFETTETISPSVTSSFVGDNNAVVGVAPTNTQRTTRVIYSKDATMEPVELIKVNDATILVGVTRK